MQIAVALFKRTLSSGEKQIWPVLFRTEAFGIGNLPPLTNKLLASAGVPYPEIEGENAPDSAEWIRCSPLEALTII